MNTHLHPVFLAPRVLASAAWLACLPVHAQDAQLSTVQVLGSTASPAYHAEEAAGAKSALPLLELPQSVRVVTRQAIDDLGATRLDQVLNYVGGVSRQNDFGGMSDNIAIRGIPGEETLGLATLLNGFSAGRGFSAPRDLAGVERIEFLKGPAAGLYGSTEPGGTLNVVSKRPLWKAANQVDTSIGSHGFKRAALDTTGPLGERFAYRLNVAVEDRDGWRDHVGTKRHVLAPAFTWKLSNDTVLECVGEVLRHESPLDRGVVAVGNRLGVVPATRFLGEPSDGDMRVDNSAHQLVLSHIWSNGWTGRLGLSQRDTSIYGYSSDAHAFQADGLLRRQYRLRDYDSEDLAVQAELQGQLQTGTVKHELLFGVERFSFRMNTRLLRTNPSDTAPYAIDIYNPVYGQAKPALRANTDTLERQRATAFYMQDAMVLAPNWRLLTGVRLDSYDQSLHNRLTGTTAANKPSATSPRVGLSWLASPQWTLYANAGRSFRPNPGSNGVAFSPEHGRALELGAKWESADRRLGATAALYEIRKRNMLTSDPANSGFSIAAGEVRSRGVEFDLSGQLATHWRLNASLAFNQVEVTRDNTLVVGSRLVNVPRVTGSMLALYEDALANGQRYGVGAGVTHVGSRLGAARSQVEVAAGTAAFELPAYTTAKLVAYWQATSSLRLTLDVDNLFDRTFYTSSYSRMWVAPGAERAITVGLQAKF